MGCRAGFLQIFDRHQILIKKRIHSVKRLPPSTTPLASDSLPEPEKHDVSHAGSTPSPGVKQSLAREAQSQAKVSISLPILEFKEGMRCSWKFSRGAPRLSVDSRAIVDVQFGDLRLRSG